jgi:purine-binding chemotaxis protein CheW
MQTLTFALKGETFAVSIEAIKEIIEYPELTSVPLMPAFLRGVMNLRGAVIPVVDLSERFHLGAAVQGRRTCVIVFEVASPDGQQVIGAMVDAVHEVVEVDPGLLDATPEFGTHVASEFIKGMLRLDTRIVVLLDLERVLSLEQLEALMVPV